MISLQMTPLNGQNSVTITSQGNGGVPATVQFTVGTSATNTVGSPPPVTYKARIIQVTSGNPAVTVMVGNPQPAGADTDDMTVQ